MIEDFQCGEAIYTLVEHATLNHRRHKGLLMNINTRFTQFTIYFKFDMHLLRQVSPYQRRQESQESSTHFPL